MARKRNVKPIGRGITSSLLMFFLLIGALLIKEYFFDKAETPRIVATAEFTEDAKLTEVHFIDVGQGDAILIKTDDGSNILIDTGPEDACGALLSYLESEDVETIELLVLTHPHADHIANAARVINDFTIKDVLMPEITANTKTFERLVDALERKSLPVTAPVLGDKFTFGSTVFTVLAPNNPSASDLNNASVVLRADIDEISFLFTGDAETLSEEDMLARGVKLSATVLKVGHHGSATATSEAFFNAVSPSYAVIMCGLNNTYHHPHTETLELFAKYSLPFYRTDTDGTRVFYTDGKKLRG